MSPTWARSALGSFLHRLHEIVERLEYADELDGHPSDGHAQQEPRPPVNPDALVSESAPFRPNGFAAVDRLLCDVMVECRQEGRSGAKIFSQAEVVWGRLKTCAQAHDEGGNLEPWRAAQNGVVNDLDALGQLVEQRLASEQVPRTLPAGMVEIAAPPSRYVAASPRVSMPTRGIVCKSESDQRSASPKQAGPRQGASPRRPGRSLAPVGNRAHDRAAFWMITAVDLIPDGSNGEELRNAIDNLGNEPKPRDVYEAMKLHGHEVSYNAVRNNPPPCWPRLRDGSPQPSWDFAAYAVDVSADSFERNLRKHRREIQGRETTPRATPSNVEPNRGDDLNRPVDLSRQEIRRRTIVGQAEAAETALGQIATAWTKDRDDAPAWGKLRDTLLKLTCGVKEDVDCLMGDRDQAALERIAKFVVECRRRAGGADDCGRDRRRP